MNIAGINYESVNDGDGVRTVVYVSGCSHNCYNCHNPQTHDINYGVHFTEKLQNEIIENIKKRPFISGITFSGGDPLHENNLDGVFELIHEIRTSFPNKSIWIYTGYTWDDCQLMMKGLDEKSLLYNENNRKRREIILQCNVMVDGLYIDSLKDITAKWVGSTNQRVINVQESLKQNKVVLHCD